MGDRRGAEQTERQINLLFSLDFIFVFLGNRSEIGALKFALIFYFCAQWATRAEKGKRETC